jgi:hypothetical protein
VADAIDVVNNVSFIGTPDHVDIKVKLITPVAMKARCSEGWHVPRAYPKLATKK